MPGPAPDVQPNPSFADKSDKPKDKQQRAADDARDNLALAAWTKPDEKKEPAAPADRKDADRKDAPAADRKDAPAGDRKDAPAERKVFARLEGVEDWEKVAKDGAKKSNYLDIRQNIVAMLPFMQIENAQGKAEDDFKTSIVQLFDKEKSEDVRTKLRQLIESFPGENRDKLLKELKDLYKDESKQKLVDGLSATEELRANERDMIDRLLNGVKKQDELQKQLATLKDGDAQKQKIQDELKQLEKDNYLATMATYPTVARLVDVASRQSVASFQDMKIGDTTDVRKEERFPEGAPFNRPSVDGVPVSWDLYLTKVRQGEVPCTVTPKLEGLLSDDRTIAFTNAADWMNKSQSIIGGMERKYDVKETWRRLQEDFKAPAEWAPPKDGNARATDAWFNAASTVRREVTSLRDYVQAYLDLKEVTPDLRDTTINKLKAKGYEIEWDELNHKLTKFKPPVPDDLRILSPKVDSLIKEWQDTRRELAVPIDKILETYAKGDKNFLKQGTFTGPQDRGFLLMEGGKIKYVVESEEVKKEDAQKRLDEAKKNVEKLEAEKPKLETDLAAQKKALEDGFPKTKTNLTKLETEEKQALELKVRQLEGQVQQNKVSIDQAKEALAKAEEQKEGGKFPARVISYVRRVDGTEEVIDRNMEGRFLTKKGIDVTDEVDYKAQNFKDKDRVQFDYTNYNVSTETVKGPDGKEVMGADGKPQVRFNIKRDFMGDHVVNFYHQFGTTQASLTKSEDHNTNDYVGVISNVTGKIRFMRADDIGGFFGWKAGQSWQEGLTVGANVAMDVAMIYLGGAGIYSGIAKRAFGEAALGAMRMAIGLTGFPLGPALRQTEWGQETLKWRHRAMMFDVFVLGLGGGALNMVRGTKAAAEAVPLTEKIAHYAMTATTAVYGPEILADVYHRMELIKGKAPIQCAMAAGNDIAIRSQNLDRLSKPYDFKDAQVLKATGDTLDSYGAALLTGVDDAKAKANIQAMIDSTKKMLDPNAAAREKDAYKETLARSARFGASKAEKVAAVSCLVLLNTDEKGGVAEKLSRNLTYKDGLKVLRDAVSTRDKEPANLIEAARLVAADRLANLKDPETGKPALAPRQYAAVCMQAAENKALPEELRKRALFDPSRPRLAFLLNELEAEEKAMDAPNVSAADRQAFFGNINGFHSSDLKTALAKMTTAQSDSAEIRAMSAMCLQIANQEKVEDRVRLMLEFNRAATKGAVAPDYVASLKKDLDASVENPQGKSADEVRADKLQAALLLRSIGRLKADDKEPIISDEAYNAKLLDCITRPGGEGKPRELMLPKDKPELVFDIIGALSVGNLKTAERQALLSILDLKTDTADNKSNNAAEKAKIAVLAVLPQMIAGNTDADIELRLAARKKLQDNLDPKGNLFAGDRPILRMALCSAAGTANMDDPKTVDLLKKTFDIDPKDKQFFEQSPLVRRAALEALAAVSRNDAVDIAKRLKDKDESDPAVARRASDIADLARVQSGGEANREEVRQQVMYKLADKSKVNFADGQSYLQNSRFKILNWNDYCDEWKKVRHDAEPGQESLLSLSRGWARISNFDYDIPNKMMDAASTELEKTRSKMPTDLVTVAKTQTDPAEARKAILALGFGLETKAESFATNTAKSQEIKAGFQVLFARGLKDLCSTGAEGEGHKNRLLAASIAENFVTGSQQIDWQARYHLYEGLKALHKDKAISDADYCEILRNAMNSPIKDQIFPKNERETGWCKAIYRGMMNELLTLQPRDEKTLGLLKGISDGLSKQEGWKDVADQAARTYGKLLETPFMTFLEFKDKGVQDKPEALAARLDGAYQKYRERLVDINKQGAGDGSIEARNRQAEAIRKNRNDFFVELYKTTEGTKITDKNDPRVKRLLEMAFAVEDTCVKEALGIALVRTQFTDDNMPYTIGKVLMAEVLKSGTQAQKDEVQLQFDLDVKRAEDNAKKDNKDSAAARQQVLDNQEMIKRYADSKINGANIAFYAFSNMTGRRMKESDATKVNRDDLLAAKRAVDDVMSNPNSRPEQFAWAMMNMMHQGPVVADDPRLGVGRRVMMENFKDNMKLAAAWSMLYYDAKLPDGDRDLCLSTLLKLRASSDPVVKAEATRVIEAFDKTPRLKDALDKAKAPR